MTITVKKSIITPTSALNTTVTKSYAKKSTIGYRWTTPTRIPRYHATTKKTFKTIKRYEQNTGYSSIVLACIIIGTCFAVMAIVPLGVYCYFIFRRKRLSAASRSSLPPDYPQQIELSNDNNEIVPEGSNDNMPPSYDEVMKNSSTYSINSAGLSQSSPSLSPQN
ncbi:hypothetical protein GQR58_015773 [Nymphon striatum]|nr:hypothetical protein GQR58_015773 [Nymphon striatum]